MDNFEINIPDISINDDFTVIYKGKEKIEGKIVESIKEIKTSKDEFMRKLRYFKRKSSEINQMNEIFIHDIYYIDDFTAFINSVKTNKIQINEENYQTILELSCKYEFYELKKEIDKFSQARPDVHLLIDNPDLNNKIDQSKEQKLAKNLDICLQNKNFINFPIPVLSRILNSPLRIVKNHHLLFEFIQKVLKKYENDENESENLEILISCLDFSEMSNEEIDLLLTNQNFTNIFNCHNSKEKMKSLVEENQSNKKYLSQLENRIASLEQKFVDEKKQSTIIIDEMKDKILKQEKTIEKYQEENNDLKNLISTQEAKLKEISKLKAIISANVESNKTIKGSIIIIGNESFLDKTKSKYILNENNSPKIGENEYQHGTEIKSSNQEFSFMKSPGKYFMHALICDKFGNSEEFISNELAIKMSIFTFEYTGRVQSVTLEKGSYKLEVWGAEGGENSSFISKCNGSFSGYPGQGGYSVGTLTLASKTKLFVYIGEKPNSNKGGWNGGCTVSPEYSVGGGGATDISLYGVEGSTEWNNQDHLYSRIIVAGGGGGSSHSANSNYCGGCGGGECGQNSGFPNVNGGTQTSGFGFGNGNDEEAYGSGGGGGWYLGGCYHSGWRPGGAGGSGFVYTSTTATNYPSGCKLNSSFYLTNASTICGNTEIPKTSGTGTEKGHRGNGYAKITPL